MTKGEQLADVAQVLSDEQLDGVIAYARYLRGQPFYKSAPPEALASIERGLTDAAAGRVVEAESVLADIDAKISARGR